MAKWSDEELEEAFQEAFNRTDREHYEPGPNRPKLSDRKPDGLRAVAALVVERLAGSEVDVETLASITAGAYLWPEHGARSTRPIADAIRTALSQQAARWERERAKKPKP